jgi:hypothetical protein
MVGGNFTFPLKEAFRTEKKLSEVLQCLVVMFFINHSLFGKLRTIAVVTLRQPSGRMPYWRSLRHILSRHIE